MEDKNKKRKITTDDILDYLVKPDITEEEIDFLVSYIISTSQWNPLNEALNILAKEETNLYGEEKQMIRDLITRLRRSEEAYRKEQKDSALIKQVLTQEGLFEFLRVSTIPDHSELFKTAKSLGYEDALFDAADNERGYIRIKCRAGEIDEDEMKNLLIYLDMLQDRITYDKRKEIRERRLTNLVGL